MTKEMSMKPILVWTIAAALVAGSTGVIVVNAAQHRGAMLIPGDNPVTEDQVRMKLQGDGWTDIRIQRDGRYFDVTAIKDNESRKMLVDSRTGRLGSKDDDDDDD